MAKSPDEFAKSAKEAEEGGNELLAGKRYLAAYTREKKFEESEKLVYLINAAELLVDHLNPRRAKKLKAHIAEGLDYIISAKDDTLDEHLDLLTAVFARCSILQEKEQKEAIENASVQGIVLYDFLIRSGYTNEKSFNNAVSENPATVKTNKKLEKVGIDLDIWDNFHYKPKEFNSKFQSHVLGMARSELGDVKVSFRGKKVSKKERLLSTMGDFYPDEVLNIHTLYGRLQSIKREMDLENILDEVSQLPSSVSLKVRQRLLSPDGTFSNAKAKIMELDIANLPPSAYLQRVSKALSESIETLMNEGLISVSAPKSLSENGSERRLSSSERRKWKKQFDEELSSEYGISVEDLGNLQGPFYDYVSRMKAHLYKIRNNIDEYYRSVFIENKKAYLGESSLFVEGMIRRSDLNGLSKSHSVMLEYYRDPDRYGRSKILESFYKRRVKELQNLKIIGSGEYEKVDLRFKIWQRKLPDNLFMGDRVEDCLSAEHGAHFVTALSHNLDAGHCRLLMYLGNKVKPVGIIYLNAMFEKNKPVLLIDSIEISPKFPYRKGIMESVMSTVIHYAKECGFKKVVLDDYISGRQWFVEDVKTSYGDAIELDSLDKINYPDFLKQLKFKRFPKWNFIERLKFFLEKLNWTQLRWPGDYCYIQNFREESPEAPALEYPRRRSHLIWEESD
ncbi:TPA: GNAT family N-acetyltransferase [archaeon]|nr:GNAT family N-acetyltransferase [Candidatus Undinarchaeales archaeon SRR5007147.bin71]